VTKEKAKAPKVRLLVTHHFSLSFKFLIAFDSSE